MRYFLQIIFIHVIFLVAISLHGEDNGTKDVRSKIEGTKGATERESKSGAGFDKGVKASKEKVFLKRPDEVKTSLDEKRGESLESDSLSFVKSFLILTTCLLIILFGVRWFKKKRNNLSRGMDDSSSVLRKIKSIRVRDGMSVEIVEIGNKLYVLGVGDDIRLLSTIEDGDEIESIKKSSVLGADKGDFKSLFLTRLKVPYLGKNALASKDKQAFMASQKKKLKTLGGRL